MPKRSELALSKRTVDGLSVGGKDAVFWDRELPGFGIRVYPSGRKIYVVQTRGPGGPKRVSLGRHGQLTADQARKQAAAVIDRIKLGGKPGSERSERPMTVADLAERYMEAHVATNCNAHTQGIYRGALDNHILPTLGSLPIASVGRSEAAGLHYALRDIPRAANRVLVVLSKMLSLAEDWGLAPPGSNPCRYVRRYKEGKRERFLAVDEYRRIGDALRVLETEGVLQERAAAALRLLMVTGCRSSEIMNLRWDDVDRKAGEIRLRDAKTGARMVPLTPTAEAVLAEIVRVPRSPWLFPGKRPDRRLSQLTSYWQRVRELAGVEDVRIHDLRHSFASRALALGESLTMIGRLLGHTKVGSTARYAHLAQDAEMAAVAKVGGSIEADILRVKTPVGEDGGGAALGRSGIGRD